MLFSFNAIIQFYNTGSKGHRGLNGLQGLPGQQVGPILFNCVYILKLRIGYRVRLEKGGWLVQLDQLENPGTLEQKVTFNFSLIVESPGLISIC